MKKLITLLVLIFCFSANAQKEKTQDSSVPFIEVTGTAELEVIPDIIYISIVLQDKFESKSEYTITAQEEKLKGILRKLDIDLKNLTLGDANSNIILYKRKDKGVRERQEYLLKVSTAAEVKDVFEALHENGIKEASIDKVDHSEMDRLRREVRSTAIKAAKDKAIYLLEAIGEAPGKPLIIREEDPGSSMVGRSNVALPNGYIKETSDTEISFKNITIKFSYYVKYAIK